MWSRRSGYALIQLLERALKPHYHVALAGSVLMRGESEHDLDLIIFPHKAQHFVLQEIHDGLRNHMNLIVTRDRLRELWAKRGITDTKHVEVWEFRSKRVDVIIFGGPT
jgi:hypothetical protein